MEGEMKLKNNGFASDRDELVNSLIREIKGDFAAKGCTLEIAEEACDMGADYARTRRFNNSGRYHNYDYRLDDGGSVKAFNYFDIFMTRLQTSAYMDAEKAVRDFFEDSGDRLFHLVREQRFGINGVFKAVMSSREAQNLSFSDYVLVIACFCAGFMLEQNTER